MAEPITLENPDVLTGCDATVKVNGQVAGFIKDIQLEENVNQTPIKALGAWRPRGFKSVDWDGTLSAEFHILAQKGTEGLVSIDTSTPVAASAAYFFEFTQKSTGKRIGNAIGHINTRGLNISTNELSGQRCQFVLRDWKPLEGYN